MLQGFKLRDCKITKLQNRQRGYMLIMLMLVIALAAMAMLAVLPRMKQQIQRDHEEEMCHRGTAYMRAIQHFYRKFGRYPTRVEELENTNNIRFLRKRYTDPLSRDPQTGKERDFKLLHMQDVTLNNGPVMPGAMIPGQNTPGMPPSLGGGGSPILQSLQPQGGLQSSGAAGASATQNASGQDNSGNPANPQTGSSSSSSTSSSASNSSSSSSSSSGFGNQVFGGGPILGVASTSKDKTIREFNKKNHYNDWMFIYDPTSDTGGLLIGPWQMPSATTLPGATPAGQLSQPPQGFGSGPSQGLGPSQPFGGGAQPSPQQPPQNSPQQ